MEFVYVVKRPDLFPLRYPQGLETRTPEEMRALVARLGERGFFVERRHAEEDSSMKQVIPYAVLVRGGDEVFTMRRLSAGGEARLHGKRSIGVGGHINPVDDATGADAVSLGLAREIDEEIALTRPWSRARAVGIINDDSTDVGSVHLGLVYVVEVEGEATVRETETLEGGFVPLGELRAACASERGAFETWSAFVIDALPALLGAEPGSPAN